MKQGPIRVLLIEDNPGDVRLIQEIAAEVPGVQFHLVHVERLTDAITYLDTEPFDVVLLDLLLPDSQRLDSFLRVYQHAPSMPIVVLTIDDDDELGLMAVQMGAQDYLIKGQTDRQLLVRALRYAIERRRLQNELEQFAYITSHDLQEPLRKIQLFADRLVTLLVRREGIFTQETSYFKRIQQTAERMQHLMEEVLQYSQTIVKTYTFIPVDLNQVLHEVLSDLEVAISQNDAHIIVRELPITDANPTQMHQLFQSLISNALKFRRPEESPVVVIASRPIEQHGIDANARTTRTLNYEISVADNGIGFDTKHLERIFGVFQHLDTGDNYTGTGIGLAACRRITEHHNGRITATSILGRGSTFTITLPQHQLIGAAHASTE